jgi:glycosyltransferase involved in cell wall biosynthesis
MSGKVGEKEAFRRKSICFISETGRVENPLQDPSVRYRCYHPAEHLMERGHFCSVVSAAKFFDGPCLDYDVYVFHRPNIARAKFPQVINGLRRLNKRLIADYDDLIFGGEDIALASSAVKNATLTPERAVAAFSNNLAGLREFDFVTASTEPLMERVKHFNPGANVAVVPNIVPNSILTVHESIGTALRPRPATSIGYFAGTKSHDKDFPVAAEVLHRVLLENPDFSLLIVGPVAIPSGLAALPNVSAAPVVNYFRLPSLMTMCATVIAPLENSAFNACKSRVKFLEAALTGCRLIASPIPDMCVIGKEHLDFAANHDDWYEALSNPLSANERSELAKRNSTFLRSHLNVHGLEVFGELK